MKYLDQAKQYLNSTLTVTKNLFVRTQLEIALFAAIGLATGVGLSNRYEAARERMFPLGFSEMHQVEMDAEKKGENIGSTQYDLMFTNDLSMKIFEASNKSHLPDAEMIQGKAQKGKFDKKFSSRLKWLMNPENKEHKYNLNDLFKLTPQKAADTMRILREAGFNNVREQLPRIITQFDQAWSDSHIDTYHTKTYTDTETYLDSKGNTKTRTVTKTKQVYAHTTHHYTYRTEHGENASRQLDQLVNSQEDITLNTNMKTASKTNEKGEQAAIYSRKPKNKDKQYSKVELLEIASTWESGSTLLNKAKTAIGSYQTIKSQNADWMHAKNNAHSTSYITYSHSDSGPKEFQLAEQTEHNARSICEAIDKATEGVAFAYQTLPKLQTTIKDYIAAVKEEKETEKKQLRTEIISMTKDLYKKNFERGFDVNGYRIGMVLVGALLGALGGAGIGFLADKGVDKLSEGNKEYNRNIRNKYR